MTVDDNVLLNARSLLDLLPEYTILEDVSKTRDGYQMKVSISISSENKLVPAVSEWYVLISEDYKLTFYPAKKNSVNVTFKHQESNHSSEDGLPYRNGRPCLEDPLSFIDNDYRITGTPAEKFYEYSRRMIEWLKAAAEDRLSECGDPFEVPTENFDKKIVFKKECLVDFRISGKNGMTYLFASSKDENKLFLDKSKTESHWGDISESFGKGYKTLFIELDVFPIKDPWMYPQTWTDLSRLCSKQHVDLFGILSKYISKEPKYLLLHFRIPQFYGEEPSYPYCIVCDIPPLKLPRAGRQSVMLKNKFKGPLKWHNSTNWGNDTLLSRGRAEVIADLKIAIIGVGALGSIVAEELSRMGSEYMILFDGDDFSASNLGRHVLSLKNENVNKAYALREKLKYNNPNLKIKHHDELSADNIKSLSDADVIIDCSANPEVLNILEKYKMSNIKSFFVASITYGAQDLVIYYEKSDSVNRTLFEEKTGCIFQSGMDSLDYNNVLQEGIGCYHPIFPARCDDMYFFASLLVKQIVSILEDGIKRIKIIKYTQKQNLGLDLEVLHEEDI